MWIEHWSDHFEGNVGVALTDTFTTDVFLKIFGTYAARLFDGCRQDSGNPYDWADNKILPHYKKLGIPTTNKRLVFSDSLGVAPKDQLMAGKNFNYVAIDHKYRSVAQPCGGIGTNFTNDVGIKPLNMVIKMTGADFGNGMIDVVKLSDDPGKYTGNQVAIDLAKMKLGINNLTV
jgi:nicotinate phosphoribosyltransferase